MRDYTQMSIRQLEELSSNFVHEEYEIMKELLRRNSEKNVPDDLVHADMQRTEEDF